MKLLAPIPLLLACCAGFAQATPQRVDCGELLVRTRDEQVKVPGYLAGRRATGRERIYFHTAPDAACRLRELFVVPGDVLEAQSEYGVYTEVLFVHPRTGRVATGWVESGRLEETGAGRAAN